MLIYQFDYESRAYIGARPVEPSDFDPRSPSTLMLEGNATLVEPPNCGPGLWPFWSSGEWLVLEQVETPDPFFSEYDN